MRRGRGTVVRARLFAALGLVVVLSTTAAEGKTLWPPDMASRAYTISPSVNPATLPADAVPASEEGAPADLRPFAGVWRGSICNNAATDVKLVLTHFTSGGAKLVYANATDKRVSGSFAYEAKLEDGELAGRLGKNAHLALAARADGDLDVKWTNLAAPEKEWCLGVLTKQDDSKLGMRYALKPPEVVKVPTGTNDFSGRPIELYTTVVRPNVSEPRPLVIINHGSPGPSSPYWAPNAVRWFAGRGYVVAEPIRRGYEPTGGGARFDTAGGCTNADYYHAGLIAASDIEMTLAHMRKQPYVSPTGTILVGQSAGGWAVLAASTRKLEGVASIINFAGGWVISSIDIDLRPGAQKNNCATNRMINYAEVFGKEAKIPTLWIYTENDSFFPPRDSQAMHKAYTSGGGKAEYHLLPAFGKDGHGLFASSSGPAVWGSYVESFLKTSTLIVEK